MLATVSSATLVGVDGHAVSVEVHVSNGCLLYTSAPAVPQLPAGGMPVPAQVRGFPGDNHKVSRPGQDLLVAAGANVRLAGLRAADAAELDIARLVGRGQVDQVL